MSDGSIYIVPVAWLAFVLLLFLMACSPPNADKSLGAGQLQSNTFNQESISGSRDSLSGYRGCFVSQPKSSLEFVQGVMFKNLDRIQSAISPEIRPTVVSTIAYIFPPNFITINSITWVNSCKEEKSGVIRSIYVFHLTDTYTGASVDRDAVFVITTNEGGMVVDW